ncbi:MAG TPA: DUF72 domain-containing protein [Deltaproteobacteria bacterium]|nr:DUF72 domain-containing protein [Deltaproteobacteria bacterium]
MEHPVHIGTSGWNYDHWKAIFYPENHPKTKWLDFYAGLFDTVEVNATFYRLPKPSTFENWRFRTPETFIWSVKASRYITHILRLNNPADALKRFFDGVGHLREKCGPILFQLPPSLSFDIRIADRFFQCVRNYACRSVLEVRHPTWLDEKAMALMSQHNCAFCVSDTAGRYPYSEKQTASFMYVRLHGSRKLYESDYKEEELQTWAEKIRSWRCETYVYFDNDAYGYAAANAKRLKEIMYGR